MQSINLLKCLASTSWGANRNRMILLYHSYVKWKLDYGCMANGSASDRILNMVSSVRNMSIRLCTGAFRLSPVRSIAAGWGNPSWIQKKSSKYFCPIKFNLTHPLNSLFSNNIVNNIEIRQNLKIRKSYRRRTWLILANLQS